LFGFSSIISDYLNHISHVAAQTLTFLVVNLDLMSSDWWLCLFSVCMPQPPIITLLSYCCHLSCCSLLWQHWLAVISLSVSWQLFPR